MRQYAAPESIPYATRYNAQNAHLAEYAAKCCKNAGKFFPDVSDAILLSKLSTQPQQANQLKPLKAIYTRYFCFSLARLYIITRLTVVIMALYNY